MQDTHVPHLTRVTKVTVQKAIRPLYTLYTSFIFSKTQDFRYLSALPIAVAVVARTRHSGPADRITSEKSRPSAQPSKTRVHTPRHRPASPRSYDQSVSHAATFYGLSQLFSAFFDVHNTSQLSLVFSAHCFTTNNKARSLTKIAPKTHTYKITRNRTHRNFFIKSCSTYRS